MHKNFILSNVTSINLERAVCPSKYLGYCILLAEIKYEVVHLVAM